MRSQPVPKKIHKNTIPEKVLREPLADKFSQPVSLKVGFLGIGEKGAEAAERFYKLGYRRVAAVTCSDTATNLPAARLRVTERDISGKRPQKVIGSCLQGCEQAVVELVQEHIGTDCSYLFICCDHSDPLAGILDRLLGVVQFVVDSSAKVTKLGLFSIVASVPTADVERNKQLQTIVLAEDSDKLSKAFHTLNQSLPAAALARFFSKIPAVVIDLKTEDNELCMMVSGLSPNRTQDQLNHRVSSKKAAFLGIDDSNLGAT